MIDGKVLLCKTLGFIALSYCHKICNLANNLLLRIKAAGELI
jgi:hypothetical protein